VLPSGMKLLLTPHVEPPCHRLQFFYLSVCPYGYYGGSCLNQCGHCSNMTYTSTNPNVTQSPLAPGVYGAYCQLITGQCLSGACQPGWSGHYCETGSVSLLHLVKKNNYIQTLIDCAYIPSLVCVELHHIGINIITRIDKYAIIISLTLRGSYNY